MLNGPLRKFWALCPHVLGLTKQPLVKKFGFKLRDCPAPAGVWPKEKGKMPQWAMDRIINIGKRFLVSS
jgi:hypothetical protein